MRPGIYRLVLASLILSGCGPRAVRSPDWILGQPARYPFSQYIVGIGSAPTSAGLAEALKAASVSARTEIAQTIEVKVDHVQQLVGVSTSISEHRTGQASWALEAEHSSLNTFTQTSTDQIIQGIELKEKYHDEKRQTLYVLAVLDKTEAGFRLEEEIRKLGEKIALLHQQAQGREEEQDLLTAIRLYREALNLSLKADVLQNQLSVIDPYRLKAHRSESASTRLAIRLTEVLLGFEFYVSVEEADFVEDTIHEALAGTDFNVRTGAAADSVGLTLWGKVTTKWDTYPALSGAGGEKLQVCRTYLSLKIVDNRTGRIAGQVNLLANSNAKERSLARERALRLLSQRVLEELPGAVYQALSMELE